MGASLLIAHVLLPHTTTDKAAETKNKNQRCVSLVAAYMPSVLTANHHSQGYRGNKLKQNPNDVCFPGRCLHACMVCQLQTSTHKVTGKKVEYFPGSCSHYLCTDQHWHCTNQHSQGYSWKTPVLPASLVAAHTTHVLTGYKPALTKATETKKALLSAS